MSFPAYKNALVDCQSSFSSAHVGGKTVVVTEGAKGMGEQAVRAFHQAGAFTVFGDVDETSGQTLISELGSGVRFVKCDVSSWDDQLQLFKYAVSESPTNAVDIVVANAGISGPDPLFETKDTLEPEKPDLNILGIDLVGVMYTIKLARHYFMQHPLDSSHDRCLIVNGSLVGFLDLPGSLQYMASKWGCRAMVRCLRQTTVVDGVRANLVAPWYVATSILRPAVQEYCRSKGIVFAEAADAAQAMLKIASDSSINGRSFAVVPRHIAPLGYMDIGKDDYEQGEILDTLQDVLLKTSHRLQVKAENQ